MRGVLVSIALLAVSWVAADPFLRMPPNSYLVRPARSAHELAQQIRGEPTVAQRYARHFKQPAYALADFFEKNLRLTKLERSGEYFVYYAPPDGRLLVKRRLLSRGKEVFVLKSTNKPVLLAECGNPLTPVVSLSRPTVSAPPAPAVVSLSAPIMAEAPSQPLPPGVEIVEVPLEEAVAADLFPPAILSELETLPETAPESPPALTPPVAAPATPMPPTVGRPSGWWALLSLIPFLIPKGGGPPEVIPEPAALMVLATGLGMLYLSNGVFRRVRNSSQRGEPSR